jgi:hypothetical protein
VSTTVSPIPQAARDNLAGHPRVSLRAGLGLGEEKRAVCAAADVVEQERASKITAGGQFLRGLR